MTVEHIASVTPLGEPEPLGGHAARQVEAPALTSSLSAIGTAKVDSLDATASAVGFAQVGGDATVSASMAPLIIAKQNVAFSQGYASAVIAGKELHVRQAAAPMILGSSVDIEAGGGALIAGGDVSVSHGVAGILLARKATVSDDSRVLIGTKGALIIAGTLLGGFAIVAVVMVLGAKRVARWRPRFTIPELPDLQRLSGLAEKLRLRQG